MKMPKDRYVEIKYVIADYIEHVGRAKVEAYAETVNAVRFRWDLFWNGCRARPGGLSFNLYDGGINDDHVDTVLRNVMKELNLTERQVSHV